MFHIFKMSLEALVHENFVHLQRMTINCTYAQLLALSLQTLQLINATCLKTLQ